MRIDLVQVLVEDALDALGIEGLKLSLNSPTIEVSADVDEDVLVDLAIKGGKVVDAEDVGLASLLDKTTVFDLSAAIRRGDRVEAELLLDRLVSEDRNLTEWVQQGRFSRKAGPGPHTLREAIDAALAA